MALAKSAIDSAFRLRPDSGEAHLALAWHLVLGYSDYDRARAELALAQQSLPNNAQVYELAGSMDRSQRRWADAIHNLERACELDPRNLPYLINLGSTYAWLHDYDQWARIMDRIVALNPDRRPGRIFRAHVELDRRADTRPLRAAIEKILTNEPGSEKDPFVAGERYTLALYDRDWDAAGRASALLSQKNSLPWFPQLGRDFWVGVVARLKGDETSARAAFMRARAQQEEEIRGHPDNVILLSDLGLIDAGLGRKEEALSEGRRAMELASSVKDAETEPYVELCFAIICAWTGERELALGQLEALSKTPGYLHLWQLALESDVGSVARRSALRKNRYFACSKVGVCSDNHAVVWPLPDEGGSPLSRQTRRHAPNRTQAESQRHDPRGRSRLRFSNMEGRRGRVV